MKKWCLFIILIGLMYACTWDQPAPKPVIPDTVVVNSCLPDSVSFKTHLQPLFNYYCVGTYCHSGNTPPGSVILDAGKSYASLQNGNYTNTTSANQSPIYLRMTSSSDPMPPYGMLSKCQTDLILKWIQQGAKNN